MSNFSFDIRALISPPFHTCPHCGKQAFGVYSFHDTYYVRKCGECLGEGNFFLPELRKKVIYIDQFAISNMMKALNKAVESHARAAADPFWLELFEALERVCKLQLAICPDSHAHQDESLLSPFYESLKRMYEQLSHGVTFDSAEHIAQTQLAVAAKAFARGETPTYDLNPERVTSSRLHEWKERLIISVNMKWPTDVVEGIRDFRDRVHDELLDVFKAYQATKETSFDYWLERERRAGARAIVESVARFRDAMQEMAEGKRPVSLGYSTHGWRRYQLIREVLLGNGVPPDQFVQRLKDFLDSDLFMDFPATRIEASLWAVIGQQAAQGRQKPPNRGMANDISGVSSLLPYCDAMFIDNECRGLLSNIPQKNSLGFPTRVFSPNNKADFIAYLQDIEAKADPQVLQCVREAYGDDCATPYLTMYEERRRAKNA